MKPIRTTVFFLMLGALCTGAIEPQKGEASGKPVYFYPAANVYFDTGNALYAHFSEEQGWVQAETLPEQLQKNLGNRAVIVKPPAILWQHNTEDLMLYSVALYGNKAALATKYKADAIASRPKPARVVVADSTKTEAKEKGGLRRFFDRIFGKKKSS